MFVAFFLGALLLSSSMLSTSQAAQDSPYMTMGLSEPGRSRPGRSRFAGESVVASANRMVAPEMAPMPMAMADGATMMHADMKMAGGANAGMASGDVGDVVQRMQAVEGDAGPEPLAGAVLLKDGSVNANLPEIRPCANAVAKVLKDAGGHVENSNENTDEHLLRMLREKRGAAVSGPTHATIRMRVPAAKFETVMANIRDTIASFQGTVTSENANVVDVSASYVDAVTRQRVEEKALKQMEVLLTRATTVQDILSVQAQMNAITQRLESAKGLRKHYEDRAAMSSLTVSLSIPYPPNEPPAQPGWSLSRSIANAIAMLVSLMQKSVDLAVVSLVLGLPAAGVALVAVLLVQRVVMPILGRTGLIPSTATARYADASAL